jgi:uncharacterized surface anchored protein
VTKTSTKGGAVLAGAKFKIFQGSTQIGSELTTDANGHVCFSGLTIGTTYTVTETTAPTGYAIDTSSKNVTVTQASSDCTVAPATVSFSDTPLSAISVSFTSEAGAGVTSATIKCTNESGFVALPEGTPHSLQHLPPGTYSCTVVVDP